VGAGGGGAGWASALRKEAEAALGGRVEWLPPEYDPERLARLYGGLDIFCYPSLAEKGETFGVAVAEAMASRCAAVVSRLGCFGDLVADGQTCLVFDHAAADADRLLADFLRPPAGDAGPALRLPGGLAHNLGGPLAFGGCRGRKPRIIRPCLRKTPTWARAALPRTPPGRSRCGCAGPSSNRPCSAGARVNGTVCAPGC